MPDNKELTATELFDTLLGYEFVDPLGHPLEKSAHWVELRRRVEDARDHLYTVEDGWVEVFTGRQFRYKEPTVEMVHIIDIAQSLGKTARYAGHTHTFYSVAEHSCLMMRYASKHNKGLSNKMLLTILLHDATEAYLPDLPTPLKHMLPEFRAFEQDLEEVIAEKFGLRFPHPTLVKDLDTRILVDERTQAMNPSDNDWGVDSLEPLGVELKFWSPVEAVNFFLHDYMRLTED